MSDYYYISVPYFPSYSHGNSCFKHNPFCIPTSKKSYAASLLISHQNGYRQNPNMFSLDLKNHLIAWARIAIEDIKIYSSELFLSDYDEVKNTRYNQ